MSKITGGAHPGNHAAPPRAAHHDEQDAPQQRKIQTTPEAWRYPKPRLQQPLMRSCGIVSKRAPSEASRRGFTSQTPGVQNAISSSNWGTLATRTTSATTAWMNQQKDTGGRHVPIRTLKMARPHEAHMEITEGSAKLHRR